MGLLLVQGYAVLISSIPRFNIKYSGVFAPPGRLHLNNKSEPKKMLILQVVYIDSGLNVHLEDLLSCIDMPLKSNKHQAKGLSRFFPSFSCQHMDLQSGSSITAQHTATGREKSQTHAEKMDSVAVGWGKKCCLCIW